MANQAAEPAPPHEADDLAQEAFVIAVQKDAVFLAPAAGRTALAAQWRQTARDLAPPR